MEIAEVETHLREGLAEPGAPTPPASDLLAAGQRRARSRLARRRAAVATVVAVAAVAGGLLGGLLHGDARSRQTEIVTGPVDGGSTVSPRDPGLDETCTATYRPAGSGLVVHVTGMDRATSATVTAAQADGTSNVLHADLAPGGIDEITLTLPTSTPTPPTAVTVQVSTPAGIRSCVATPADAG